MRELISKKQLEETKLGQFEQIKLKAQQREREKEENRYWHEVEMRTQQNKYFHDQIEEINRNQRHRQMVETLQIQMAHKSQSTNSQKTEAQIECERLCRKMEECKHSDEQRKLKHFQEAEQWKKDLQVTEYRNDDNLCNAKAGIEWF